MAQLVIKGHATRGKEVIEILEMLGGSNPHNYSADCESLCFHIGENTNSIYYNWVRDCYEDGNTLVFTLEEFLEKFPYKVGDKVIAYAEGRATLFAIQDMRWNDKLNKVEYKICSSWLDTGVIFSSSYKEETMEKVKDNWAKWDLPDGYDFQDKDGNIINTSVIRLVKKQPQYPKTYEECCKVLNLTKYPPALVPNKSTYINQYKDFPCYYEIQKLAELIVCRNAYWKIAGDQMGLGKPWEPDYIDDNVKSIIGVHRNHLDFNSTIERNYILIFPTVEMRDAFYENFKELIESCKELL